MHTPAHITAIEFRFMIYPQDFDRSRSFYRDTLGLPIVKEWNYGTYSRGVMFEVGGTILELITPSEDRQPVSGVGLSISVPDVWKLWDEMKNGDNIVFVIRGNDWGDSSFCVSDPDGLPITFFTRRI